MRDSWVHLEATVMCSPKTISVRINLAHCVPGHCFVWSKCWVVMVNVATSANKSQSDLKKVTTNNELMAGMTVYYEGLNEWEKGGRVKLFRHHLNLKLLLINGELASCSELQIFSSDDESIERRHTIITLFRILPWNANVHCKTKRLLM